MGLIGVIMLGAAALAPNPPTDPPAAPPAAAPDTTTPDITVNAQRPDVVQKIDRRVYAIPADAKSASADGVALLRGLPAITIGLDDAVSLLGAADVTVLVDNKVPPDGNKVLRSLHGADIDHIEVMTNPSAEYAPDGTGGIINIVLKKKRRQGTSGSVIANADSMGAADVAFSLKHVAGPWSLDSELTLSRLSSQTGSATARAVESEPGAAPTRDLDSDRQRFHAASGLVSQTVAYRIDDRTTATAIAWLGLNRGIRTDALGYLGQTADFASFNQQSDRHYHYDFGGTELSLDHDGMAKGETLKFDSYFILAADTFTQANALSYAGSGESAVYVNTNDEHQTYADAKVDYVRPLPGGRILSLGASDLLRRLRYTKTLDNSAGVADIGPGYVDTFDISRNVFAAYGSLQQPVGAWTLLPALRFEWSGIAGHSAVSPAFTTHSAVFYPSVHLSRALATGIDMNLSYTRRTDRPGLSQFDPFTLLTSSTSVTTGNPDLKNQTTDAYEANFALHHKALTASMIAFDRETANLWNTAYTVTPTGLTQSQQINLGHRSDRGAEFDINTPLGKRFKVTASVNLFDSRVPVDPGSIDEFRYTGNTTLEWNAPAQGARPGDSAQIQFAYQSPEQDYQTRMGPILTPSVSYSHALAEKLSVVLKVENAFGVQHNLSVLNAPLVQQVYDARTIGPRFAIKFVRNFGS